MLTAAFTWRCIRAGTWMGRSGTSCRIVRGAKQRGMVLMSGTAAFVATTGVQHRTSSGRHADRGPFSRSRGCSVRKLPPRFWSGTRHSKRSSDCRIRREARLAQGGEIVLGTVEIAERCEQRVDGSQIIDRNASGIYPIEKKSWAELVGSK